MVEALHAKGSVARLQVDMQHEAVVVPDFIREKWPEMLVIDLDPSWPLDIAYTDDAIEADLSFGGYVTRCVLPLTAILVVVDRETGKGVRIEANSREARQHDREFELAAQQIAKRDGASEAKSSRRHRRPKAQPDAEPAVAVVAAVDAPPDSEEARQNQAERRRAVFRVIDGDG